MTETLNIIRELFVDDVYHAERVFDIGDKWLDVGCHRGIFSTLALAHGADVVGAVDADADALEHYSRNVAGAQTFNRWITESVHLESVITELDVAPNAVKLDVQGSEDFLAGYDGFSWVKDTGINKLLLEWHYTADIEEIVGAITAHFDLQFVDRAVDILTSDETFIIYATKEQ